jgi:hypothetical protein
MDTIDPTNPFLIAGYREMVDIHDQLSGITEPHPHLKALIGGLGNLLMHGQSHIEYTGVDAALIREALTDIK